MEMTKISTLSVPEVRMNVDPADAIRFCECRSRRGQNRLAEPSVDFIFSNDSPTATGMCYRVGETRLGEQSAIATCPVLGVMQQQRDEGGTAGEKEVLPSLGSVTVDLSRFFKQAAISVGLVSTGWFCPARFTPDYLPHGSLARWLRSIADDDPSRPILELTDCDSFTFVHSVAQEAQARGAEKQQPDFGSVPGPIPGFVRVPLESVRIASCSEPEQFDWDSVDYKVQVAVEQFYEPGNANSETT